MKISPELIAACKKGNQLQQKELYFQLLPYLRAVGMRYLKNQDLIKDVLQEAFINIFKSIKQYDPNKAAFHKWAVKITINAALKYNERIDIGSQEEFLIDKHDVPQKAVALEKMSNDALLVLMKEMPEGYFEVFNLYVIDGYSHQEIAEMLGISEALSRKKLSRGRTWLKKILDKNYNSVAGFLLAQITLN